MPSSIKNSGTYRTIDNVSIKVSGVWRTASDVYVKVAGVWKKWIFSVPNIVNLTRTNANTAITGASLVVGTATPSNTSNSGLNQIVFSQSPAAGTVVDPNSTVTYSYYQYVAPPSFGPSFPPSFSPPSFPPPFSPPPPFPPPFTPPYFNPPPTSGGKSISVDTLVRTPNGLVAAGALRPGDILISANIQNFPYDEFMQNANQIAINWREENPQIEFVTTTITEMSTRKSSFAIVINDDIFADTHYILIKRNNIAQFIDVRDVIETDMVFSYESNSWENIYILEKIEAEYFVICINTEPYDIFFTENMLVHDSHHIILDDQDYGTI